MMNLIIIFLFGIILFYTYITAYNCKDYIFVPIAFILMIAILITATLTGILLFAIGYGLTLTYYLLKELKRIGK